MTKPLNYSIFKKYYFLIGLALFVFIASRLDFNQLYSALYKTKPLTIILGLIIVIPITLVKAWRWNNIKKNQGLAYTFLDSFLIYQIGLALGSITPGQAGEFIKICYLKNPTRSWGKVAVSVVIDRLADLGYLLVIGYLGILILLGETQKNINLIYLFFIVSLFGLIIIIRKGWHKKLLKIIFRHFIPLRYQTSWRESFADFIKDFKSITPKQYLIILSLTLLGWMIYYLQSYIFILSLGFKIPLIKLAIAVTTAGLLSLLPISFLGIGTREAALIIILAPYLDSSTIIIFSQLILLANIFSIILGLIFLKLKPLPFTLKNYDLLEK
ncbi:MAG: lysylphosphatidylglycerol synthase transmembrane domain-containing protein [Candidatus Buchananbacteria bacterium]